MTDTTPETVARMLHELRTGFALQDGGPDACELGDRVADMLEALARERDEHRKAFDQDNAALAQALLREEALAARLAEVEAERNLHGALLAEAYGATLDWEAILQDAALWQAQDDIAKSRVAAIDADARADALAAKLAEQKPQPMSTAPRDGTPVLAWWPSPYDSQWSAWTTTRWKTTAGGIGMWQCAWEYVWEGLECAPTLWLPHPRVPE
jgi:hypothetical protein